MRRIAKMSVLSFAVALALLTAQPVTSQQWTPEEQELLDHAESCSAAWRDAVANEDFEVWGRACPYDDELIGWWSDAGAPSLSIKWAQRNFKVFAEFQKRTAPSLRDVRPVLVRIRGDSAVIFSYVRSARLDKDNEPVWSEFKRANWYYRKDGQWVLAVVMEAAK